IGPGCTAAWRSELTARVGHFVGAADTAKALSALDGIVSEWRSSVVVVGQVTSRQPLQVSAGSAHTTVGLGEPAIGADRATAPAASTGGSGSESGSGSGDVMLAVGLVLLAFLLLLVVLV